MDNPMCVLNSDGEVYALELHVTHISRTGTYVDIIIIFVLFVYYLYRCSDIFNVFFIR